MCMNIKKIPKFDLSQNFQTLKTFSAIQSNLFFKAPRIDQGEYFTQ